jgi:putative component of toxin-antitoxin plasmid stabilization module
MEVRKSKEFDSWLAGLSVDYKKAVYSRIYKIEKNRHFGDVKNLKQGLYELRWRNGMRVNFYSIRRFKKCPRKRHQKSKNFASKTCPN